MTTLTGVSAPPVRTVELAWRAGRVVAVDEAGFFVEPFVGAASASGRRDVRVIVRYEGREPAVASVRFRVPIVAVDAPWWLVPGLF